MSDLTSEYRYEERGRDRIIVFLDLVISYLV